MNLGGAASLAARTIAGADGDKDVAVPIDARFMVAEPFRKQPMTSPKSSSRLERTGELESRQGFTLVELLVVVVLVSLLSALLMPALGQARKRARAVGCLGNLRQWSLATHLYLADHDDLLPPEGSSNAPEGRTGWYTVLPRALGIPAYHEMPWRNDPRQSVDRSPWICPANTNRSNGNNLFHYCLNQHVDGTGADDRPVRFTSLRDPETLVWLFDNGKRAAVAQQNNVHTNLHARGAHFLFLAGRVGWHPNTDYWDFIKNTGRTNHPSIRWRP
jgi:prepilin-type N-terminal cleavage/methylation domain-containing protein